MRMHIVLDRLLVILVLVSLTLSGSLPAVAQDRTPGDAPDYQEKVDRVKEKQEKRITQAEREAAADRAAEGGFELGAIVGAEMDMTAAAPRYFSHPNYANSPLPGNVVSEWNYVAQKILQPSPMMNPISMSASFVYLAYIQAAVYDALVAIEGGYQPYAYSATPNPTASREAAVATATYRVLQHFLPDLAPTARYNAALATILDGPAKDAGIAVGEAAAAQIIALRSGDVLSGQGSYVLPPPGPGVWEPTLLLPDGTPDAPWDPWMAELAPFLRATPDLYRPGPPPDLTSQQYADELNEVKDLGGAVSTLRTPEQTAVAYFWGTNMVIQSNASYRHLAESRGLGLLETARLMAMGNMVATDSLIATFDTKYFWNFWRPVTAIQRADTDGNVLTDPDPTWTPAMVTPNFPEYVAGHGSFVSAQAEVYTQFFGTPQIEIDLGSTATGKTRHYATADELRTEIINARTWGGLHFRNSSVLAVSLGQQLVTDALAGHFAVDPATDTGQHATISGGLQKFVDGLPGLGEANANNLGQYIPVAVPDTTTYPGSDYYEIAVVQYREKMHSNLPATLLRGYVQLSTGVILGQHVQLTNANMDGTETNIAGFFGVTPPHYLGPTIQATKDRPVRIKFHNLLPTGMAGNLFIPVDTTVMGSGMGPLMDPALDTDPLNPMCGMWDGVTPKDPTCYAENRATLHLHGGISPWISDGTPHQWITPATENTAYPQGVSVVPVPDMSDPGVANDGVMTFYYTNQQSARLMFYHDHSYGITRLNVYAGGAAPYLIADDTEQSLVAQGLIPDAASTIPLIVQDKTFVPSEVQLAAEDELWNVARWGGLGSLWLPHVYSPAQNPGDSSGVNQFGRWAYGPWFWPPTLSVEHGPVANPYYDPTCNPDLQWCEPPLMPGTPYNSMGMEAFMDTPVVNGTVYPTLTVDPKAYRFRVLNAANDRFFNLSLYQAVDANGTPCDVNNAAPAPSPTGVTCTEVALNPAEVAAALVDPTIFPTPLAGTEGPSWIQIGTEGGFLPAPVVLPAQPTTWVNDPTVFNAGNVDLHSLLVGPAERADVVVDFSAFAGQTLILYNDAPAAFPARDPRYDYYTGDGDYRDTGGAPSTLPGYGPNTRTVMQIRVNAAPAAPAFDLPALETAFLATSLGGQGVFETAQHPIVVGQGAYNSAYGTAFQNSGPLAGLAQIFDTSLTFQTLLNTTLTMPLQPKQIQDEMGESFDPIYGRMGGFLGLETPNAQAGLQNMILYPYGMPPTEILRAIELPPGVELTPIASTDDGSQIWKITHNGVDTHPIHVHLYDVQLINRVGWDGIIRKPDLNELGWKETVRISPLEDTIVALRPLVPNLPWDLPNSVRLIDPTMPEGTILTDMGLPIFDPSGEPVEIVNHVVNYGWEYVWHCHILSHEEMDMMRPQVIGVRPKAPSGLAGTVTGSSTSQTVVLTWTDNAMNETHFVVQRAETATGIWADVGVAPANTTTYSDVIGNTSGEYSYRVYAANTVGDTAVYPAPSIGFPTTTMDSEFSNSVTVTTVSSLKPAAPTNLTAELQAGPQVLLTWTDNADNETRFVVERSLDGVTFPTRIPVPANPGTGIVTYVDATVLPGNTYTYRVVAANAAGLSAYSNTATVSLSLVPASPAPVTAIAAVWGRFARVRLNWTNVANETGYVVQRATNDTFTADLVTTNVAADVATLTTGNLARGTAYYFRVQAVNAAGASPWANAAPFPIITP